jgi:hypothetical protein
VITSLRARLILDGREAAERAGEPLSGLGKLPTGDPDQRPRRLNCAIGVQQALEQGKTVCGLRTEIPSRHKLLVVA